MTVVENYSAELPENYYRGDIKLFQDHCHIFLFLFPTLFNQHVETVLNDQFSIVSFLLRSTILY